MKFYICRTSMDSGCLFGYPIRDDTPPCEEAFLSTARVRWIAATDNNPEMHNADMELWAIEIESLEHLLSLQEKWGHEVVLWHPDWGNDNEIDPIYPVIEIYDGYRE